MNGELFSTLVVDIQVSDIRMGKLDDDNNNNNNNNSSNDRTNRVSSFPQCSFAPRCERAFSPPGLAYLHFGKLKAFVLSGFRLFS